jgi:probable blue pigment (indigoidine) exporter
MQASRTRLTLAAAVAPLTWGSTYAVTTQWLPSGEPLFTATMRALPAGLLLLAVTRRLPFGVWWWRAAVLGTLNIGAFFALLFVAAYRLPGGMAAVLGAIQPLIVAGLSVPILRQRPSRLTLLAGAVGVGGVALVVLQAVTRPDPIGVAAGLGGAAAMAGGIVLGKRWGRPGSDVRELTDARSETAHPPTPTERQRGGHVRELTDAPSDTAHPPTPTERQRGGHVRELASAPSDTAHPRTRTERQRAGVSVIAFTGWQLTFGGLLLAPIALLTEGLPSHLSTFNVGGYVYLAAINTLLAYWLWFRATAVLAPTALSFLSLLSPVGAAVIGWLALGQRLSPLQLLGLVLALGGTLLGQLRPTTSGKASSPCPEPSSRTTPTLESSTKPTNASTPPVPSSTAA